MSNETYWRRSEEIDILLDRALRKRSSLTVLSGETQIGKSTLLGGLERELKDAGVVVGLNRAVGLSAAGSISALGARRPIFAGGVFHLGF